MSFLELFGPLLIKNGFPRSDTFIIQEEYKKSYKWGSQCDMCKRLIVGRRFEAYESSRDYDLCVDCYSIVKNAKPTYTFKESRIPDIPLPLEKIEVPTMKMLDGKIVFLYFGSHSSRNLSLTLDCYYKRHRKAKNFEVVYVSCDYNESEYGVSFDKMPWFSLPFCNQERKKLLMEKYEVEEIPTLVILSPQGQLINQNASRNVFQDSAARNFPYEQKTLDEMLGKHLINNKGDTIDLEQLNDKVIGLYFFVSCSTACQNSILPLTQLYQKLKSQGKQFEIISVMGESYEDEFSSALSKMPWFSILFEDSRLAYGDLKEAYNIADCPYLVVLGPKRHHSRPVFGSYSLSRGNLIAAEGYPWSQEGVIDCK